MKPLALLLLPALVSCAAARLPGAPADLVALRIDRGGSRWEVSGVLHAPDLATADRRRVRIELVSPSGEVAQSREAVAAAHLAPGSKPGLDRARFRVSLPAPAPTLDVRVSVVGR